MVTGTGRMLYPDTVQLGGLWLRLARDVDPRSGLRSGPRLWKVETAVPPGEQDWDKFRLEIGAGHYGMGGSVRTGYRQLNDYALGVHQEEWGYLGPGLLGTRMHLGLTRPVIAMESIRDAEGNHYLYVAERGPTLKKVQTSAGGGTFTPTSLLITGTPATVVNTRVFAHVSAGVTEAAITDMVVLKDGVGPGAPVGRFWWLYPPAAEVCRMLIGFGASAQLAQLDTVGVGTTPDVYAPFLAGSYGRAFAGLFSVALSNDNLTTAVWKTTGSYFQDTGAFSRIQSARVSAPSIFANLTAMETWAPLTEEAGGTVPDAGAFQIGEKGSSITALAQFGRGVVVAKPEGVFAFDQTYNAYVMFATGTYRHDDSGRNMAPWGHQLLVPTAQDLVVLPPRTDAVAGPSTLPSVADNPVRGRVTATATYGRYAFLSLYDGRDSYLVRIRRRLAEPVPQEFLHFPMVKLTDTRCDALRVFDDGTGAIYLGAAAQFGTEYDVIWWQLDPEWERRYTTGGVWYSERQGSWDAATVVEKVSVGGVGFQPGDSWQLELVWDEGTAVPLGTLSATGPGAFTLPAGTRGYRYQFRATCTVGAPTHRPRLAAGEDGALLVVEGLKQPEQVDRMTFTIEASPNTEGDWQTFLPENGWQTWWTLKSFETRVVNLIAEAYFGDTDPHAVQVQHVQYREGPQGDGDVPTVLIDVTCRLLMGSEPAGSVVTPELVEV